MSALSTPLGRAHEGLRLQRRRRPRRRSRARPAGRARPSEAGASSPLARAAGGRARGRPRSRRAVPSRPSAARPRDAARRRWRARWRRGGACPHGPDDTKVARSVVTCGFGSRRPPPRSPRAHRPWHRRRRPRAQVPPNGAGPLSRARRPAATVPGPWACRRHIAGRPRRGPRRRMPRSALRRPRPARLGRIEGRMTSRSARIGLARAKAGLPPPNRAACRRARMKDQVTASMSPRAASAALDRRARGAGAGSGPGAAMRSRAGGAPAAMRS